MSDLLGIIRDSHSGGGLIRCAHRNQETPEMPRAYSTDLRMRVMEGEHKKKLGVCSPDVSPTSETQRVL